MSLGDPMAHFGRYFRLIFTDRNKSTFFQSRTKSATESNTIDPSKPWLHFGSFSAAPARCRACLDHLVNHTTPLPPSAKNGPPLPSVSMVSRFVSLRFLERIKELLLTRRRRFPTELEGLMSKALMHPGRPQQLALRPQWAPQ